jgi:hypothetical protein
MIIIYSEKEVLNKPARDCIRLFPSEIINIGSSGIFITNSSFETQYIFSSEIKLTNLMKVDTPIQEEDLK